jgi:Ca2+-binding EF-hand superfamily protein
VATVEDTNTDFTGTLVYQYKDEEGNWCDLIEETDRSDYDTSSRTHSFPLSEIENLSEITQGKSTLTMRASFTSLNGKSNVSPEITVTLPKALSPYDVNADGEVDVTDITCVAAMILYGDTTTRGDVNGDGVISVADITAIAEQLLRPENSIKISNKEADGEKGGEAAARR